MVVQVPVKENDRLSPADHVWWVLLRNGDPGVTKDPMLLRLRLHPPVYFIAKLSSSIIIVRPFKDVLGDGRIAAKSTDAPDTKLTVMLCDPPGRFGD